MSTTYSVGIAAPTLSAPSATQGRGFFGRMMDRLVAARMKQAELEVRRQMALMPPAMLERIGYTLKNDSDLPFVR